MVHLNTVKTANADLVKNQPIVAVFAGGTSGIAESTVRQLAKTHADTGKGLRLYIIGRNTNAANSIISDCQKVCPKGKFTFVKANDLALLKDVDIVCEKLVELEKQEAEKGKDAARIDFLMMSQAVLPWAPSKVTTEGLEQMYSLLYYSRMRMVTKLLPLLTASSMPAHVVSIYAAGMEGKLLIDDLSLNKSKNYSLAQERSHTTYMTTLFFEHLAAEHKGRLSLIHIFPSLVVTQGFDNSSMPFVFRLVWKSIGQYIAKFFAVPLEESGIRMLSLATPRYPPQSTGETRSDTESSTSNKNIATGSDGASGSGAYALNWDGESIPVAKKYQKLQFSKEEISRRVLEHTYGVFERIEAGKSATE